jgi:hypothetical protein
MKNPVSTKSGEDSLPSIAQATVALATVNIIGQQDVFDLR